MAIPSAEDTSSVGAVSAGRPDRPRRRALSVATSRYRHERLPDISAPAAGSALLAQVLGDLDVGRFEVETVVDADVRAATNGIHDFFSSAGPDDFLFAYFSCHGLRSANGQLYLASTDTDPERLSPTAISASFLAEMVDGCRARTVVLVVDCSHAGAYPGDPRSRGSGDRIVIVTAGASELAHESEPASGAERSPSFAEAFFDGLQTGGADRDQNGLVTVREAFDYAANVLREADAEQTPQMRASVTGDVVLCQAPPRQATKGEAARGPADNDHVEWQADAPTTRDMLRRRSLAQAVAMRLQRRVDDDSTTFLILLDGSWGSGKSSILRMVEEILRSQRWAVANYDAWQQSRLGKPWWTLLSAVRQAVFGSLSPGRRAWTRTAEMWRLQVLRTPLMLAALFVAVAVALVPALRPGRLELSSVSTAAQALIAVIAALSAIWAGAAVGIRALFWGSQRWARLLEDTTDNPAGQIAEHIGWLVGRGGRPLLVLIDDIDRCEAATVVEILESVQTILRDATPRGRRNPDRLTAIVVAADSAWLRRAFEQRYSDFTEVVSEPGRSLGHLFCEKVFQLVVPMPNVGPVARGTFFASLLSSDARAGTADADLERLRTRLAGSRSESDVVAALEQAPQDQREELAPLAVAALNRVDVQRDVEHTLARFTPLLPPNLRSMKRFVNDYSMARMVRTLEGNPVPTDALAQWTVLCTRWPILGDHLAAHPESIPSLTEAGPDTAWPTAELTALAQDPDVRTVVAFPAGTTLTPELVRTCCGETYHESDESRVP